jgi:hypothetical protein
MKFRPWGAVDWVLSLGVAQRWRFIGALGTEERSLCGWSYLRTNGLTASELFLEVGDVESVKYAQRTRNALAARKSELVAHGGSLTAVRALPLMSELFRIQRFAKEADDGSDSVVLDITSFPKKFFFTILRQLVFSSSVKNLVLTYTSPAAYADDAPLYENIETWQTLPGFASPSSDPEMWIVSIGFLVESLRYHFGSNPNSPVKLLMPFPAPLGSVRRMWESVEGLRQNHVAARFSEHRVDGLDMSAAFDRIVILSKNLDDRVAFVPFGPKPISAAMCLHALHSSASVHYAQPTVYHPEYSRGVLDGDASRAIAAYWIKHDRELLYKP